jgi:hypothetical protein
MQNERQTAKKNRKIIWLGPALLSVVGVMGVLVMLTVGGRTQSDPTPSQAPHHVSFIGSNDPRFDDILAHQFPGVGQVPGFQNIRPLLAIVDNDCSIAVNAYVIKWAVIGPDQTESDADLSVVREASPSLALSGEYPVLNSGGIMLVSPFFSFSPRQIEGPLQAGAKALEITFGALAFKPLVSKAQSASSVKASLDGIVFVDGLFSGPDASNLYERFENEQQGQVDEATAILNLFTTSVKVTDDQIRDQLNQQIYESASSSGTDSASLHTAAAGRQASRFLEILESRGQVGLKKMATRVAQARRMTLQRVAP